MLIKPDMEQTNCQRSKCKKCFPISLRAFVLSLLFIAFIVPFKSLGVYVDFDGDDDAEVTITKQDNGMVIVEGNGTSRLLISNFPIRRLENSKSICEKNEILSVKDGNGSLLGTVTRIEQGTYITARHVFAGKNPASIKYSNNVVEPLSNKFKRYFHFINSRTNKPLDLLVIVDNEDIQIGDIRASLFRLMNRNLLTGKDWSSCQYGVHDSGKTFSQFSEGIIKLISEDQLNLYLGVNQPDEDREAKYSDLTTFGSSGASIWVDSSGNPTLAGIVSCLQTFSDKNSQGKLVFPKIISLNKVLTSDAYYFEETTLEKLRQNPQEKEPYCTFTDGKGGGGFLTSDDGQRENLPGSENVNNKSSKKSEWRWK